MKTGLKGYPYEIGQEVNTDQGVYLLYSYLPTYRTVQVVPHTAVFCHLYQSS